MSEEITKSFNPDSTNPLPFEEFVRQNIALLLQKNSELQEQQAKMYQEMLDGFSEVGRHLRLLNEQQAKTEEGLADLKEDIKELDFKVDLFIREQIKIKRRLDEVRESAGLVN